MPILRVSERSDRPGRHAAMRPLVLGDRTALRPVVLGTLVIGGLSVCRSEVQPLGPASDAGAWTDNGPASVEVRAWCSSVCGSADLVPCSESAIEVEPTCAPAGCDLTLTLESDTRVGLIGLRPVADVNSTGAVPTVSFDPPPEPETGRPLYFGTQAPLRLRLHLNAQPAVADGHGRLLFEFDHPTARDVFASWSSGPPVAGTTSLTYLPEVLVLRDGESATATITNRSPGALMVVDASIVGPDSDWTPSVDDFVLVLPEGLQLPFTLCEDASIAFVVAYSNRNGSLVDLAVLRLLLGGGGSLAVPITAR